MALTTMNFRLEAADSSGVEEYRIHFGDIEIRQARQRHGTARSEDEWRRLSSGEIAEHVRRNTAVAQWLLRRLGWQRLLLACTDKETIEMFGVPQAPVDRRAA